jgi:hypothetical protein
MRIKIIKPDVHFRHKLAQIRSLATGKSLQAGVNKLLRQIHVQLGDAPGGKAAGKTLMTIGMKSFLLDARIPNL